MKKPAKKRAPSKVHVPLMISEETLADHRREAYVKGMMFGAECARGVTQMNLALWPGCKRFVWKIAERIAKGEDIAAIQDEVAVSFVRMDEESALSVAEISRQKAAHQAAMDEMNLGVLGRFFRMIGLR